MVDDGIKMFWLPKIMVILKEMKLLGNLEKNYNRSKPTFVKDI